MSNEKKLDLAREIYPDSKRARKESFTATQWAGVERAWEWIVDAYVARIKRHPPFQNLTDAGEEYMRGLAEQAASDFFTHAKTASPNDTTVFVVDLPKEPTVKQEPTIYGAPIIEDAHMPSGYGLVGVNMSNITLSDAQKTEIAKMQTNASPPTHPWTEAQREAAVDLSYTASRLHKAHPLDTPDEHAERLCAAIAKVAPLFIVPDTSALKNCAATDVKWSQPEPPFDDMEGRGPCGGKRCFRQVDGNWIHSSKSYATCSERTPAPSTAPAGVPDVWSVDDQLYKTMRAFGWDTDKMERVPVRLMTEAILRHFTPALRTRDERIADLERELAERCDQVDALQHERDKVMARLGGNCQPHEIEDRIRGLQMLAGSIATRTKERDEARADSARTNGLREQLDAARVLVSDNAAERDAALARVAELEKRGAVDVEAWTRSLADMAQDDWRRQIPDAPEHFYSRLWHSARRAALHHEPLLRKHSRDVRRITREELTKGIDAYYEARTGSRLASAPHDAALRLREDLEACLRAALRAIGFEVEA